MVYIYLIEIKEHACTKIGQSYYPPQRAQDLQTSCPFELTVAFVLAPHIENFEGHLHKQFAAHRMRGEWFNLTAQKIFDAIDPSNYTLMIQEYYGGSYSSIETLKPDLCIRWLERYPKDCLRTHHDLSKSIKLHGTFVLPETWKVAQDTLKERKRMFSHARTPFTSQLLDNYLHKALTKMLNGSKYEECWDHPLYENKD